MADAQHGGPVRPIAVRAGAVARPLALLRSAGAAVRWYVTELMGDGAYRVYREHHERHHPGVAPLNERAFWREKMDAQDRDPGARCC